MKLVRYDDDDGACPGHGFGSDSTLVVPDDFDAPLPDDITASFSS